MAAREGERRPQLHTCLSSSPPFPAIFQKSLVQRHLHTCGSSPRASENGASLPTSTPHTSTSTTTASSPIRIGAPVRHSKLLLTTSSAVPRRASHQLPETRPPNRKGQRVGRCRFAGRLSSVLPRQSRLAPSAALLAGVFGSRGELSCSRASARPARWRPRPLAAPGATTSPPRRCAALYAPAPRNRPPHTPICAARGHVSSRANSCVL